MTCVITNRDVAGCFFLECTPALAAVEEKPTGKPALLFAFVVVVFLGGGGVP